ncbi:hypothetical protein K8B33_15080 [Alcanivorax sp. JB21]|uniref:hypothetical protein n=1 Tax=Alcanivorax limicola TaxID=2874102 RepID=UPI001CBEF411|nr:hypothetical protein [Alcanivorax limicola]MBZ2188657.1 hypothetical protein [Alcanivorax limicola]MBZ2190432.1 hypothetical protein [Alcanivorax limicola]
MKKEKVRCWKVGMNGELFITYPEGDMGHRLICCGNCGEIHAVNVTKQLYIEPDLEEHLRSVMCSKCGRLLAGNWMYYPEHHIDDGGRVCKFERSYKIPIDADSVVVEFPEVFS